MVTSATESMIWARMVALLKGTGLASTSPTVTIRPHQSIKFSIIILLQRNERGLLLSREVIDLFHNRLQIRCKVYSHIERIQEFRSLSTREEQPIKDKAYQTLSCKSSMLNDPCNNKAIRSKNSTKPKLAAVAATSNANSNWTSREFHN